MKLAARLTNEKGTVKVIAGNEYIDIDITVGNRTLASLTVRRSDELPDGGSGYALYDGNDEAIYWLTDETKGKRTGDKCYKCTKQAKYITHTDKDGNILPHARFTCEEHHYSD